LFTAILLAIYICLSSLEWQLLDRPNIINGGELLPMYARTSLIFGSLIICYWAIISEGKANNLIRDISQESLSIYVMHRYILQFLEYIAVAFSIIINPVIEILLAIIIPIAIGKFLKQYYIGRVMLNASYPNK
jgi:surface polysaccharide O-acyltransferase-like enzyme